MGVAVDSVLAANERFAADFDRGDLAHWPAQGLAVLTCMDVRLQVHEMLGLRPGEANILRNAGGIVTEDVVRSLVVAQRRLGVDTVMVINHTECGLCKLDEKELIGEMRATGDSVAAPARFHAFDALEDNVRRQVLTLRTHPCLGGLKTVRGFVYQVRTGRLVEVDCAPQAG